MSSVQGKNPFETSYLAIFDVMDFSLVLSRTWKEKARH